MYIDADGTSLQKWIKKFLQNLRSAIRQKTEFCIN